VWKKEAVMRCSGGCGLSMGEKIKRGTPCQATIPSKIFQEMSNYVKEIDKNLLIVSSIDGLKIHKILCK
jgi:hypothetical protein